MNREKAAELAESGAGFVIMPGYYYSAMWYFELPQNMTRFRKGGNVNGILYRKADEPNKWRLTYRVRHYKDERIFGGDDIKNWHRGERECGSEEEAFAAADEFFRQSAFVAHAKVDMIEVHGDCEAFYSTVRRVKPPWLHIGVPDADGADSTKN